MQFEIRQQESSKCPLEQVGHAKEMFIITSKRNSQLQYKKKYMSTDETKAYSQTQFLISALNTSKHVSYNESLILLFFTDAI